ncbi:MAG: LolA-related protein [Burkholderiales bacterium]
MISGTRRVSAALALAWALAAFGAEPWTLERLLAGFAAQRESRASFVEKKTVQVLERPLVSSGELRYEAPDRLEKRTLRPKPELLRLEGDTLTLERGDERLRLDLRSYPEAAAFVQSIRGTLAGDQAGLERAYRLHLEGAASSWALTLTPREAGMASLVESVRIAGRRADVSVIEIRYASGDRTLMSVQRLGGR